MAHPAPAVMPLKAIVELWKRNLYSLWATEFLAAGGMALVLPFLPFYIRELGVQDLDDVARWSGYVFAAPYFASALLTPIWGWLGDKYGRRIMLIRALFGFAVSTILMAFARNVFELLFLRVLQGGISGFVAATLAIVTTSTPRERIGYALGFLQTSLTTGTIVGPLIGGFLADRIGFRNVFLFTGALAILATFLVLFMVREQARPANEPKVQSWVSNYRFVFTSPSLLALFFAGFVTQSAIMAIQPILSLFVETLWGETEHLSTLAGGVFAITGLASLISAPIWGKKGDKLGFNRMLSLTLLFAGITYAPQAFVTQSYQLYLLRFVHGLFLGGILPTLYTLTSLNAPKERRGGILGITRGGHLLGNICGPVVGGWLAASFGIRSPFLYTATLLIIMSFGVTRIIREPGRAEARTGETA